MSNSIFHSKNISNDYPLFEEALFKSSQPKYKLDSVLKVQIKKYHHLTYIICLLDKKVSKKFKLYPHKFLFIGEILSDLLAISNISLIGFYRSSKILERRIIENFYNHIFYFDHKIEFELLNAGKNEYTPILELKKYFIGHPTIISQPDAFNTIKKFNDFILNQYHDLCRHVHTKGFDFMDLAKNLKQIKPKIDIVNYFKELNATLLPIIFLLLKFHINIPFTMTEQAIIKPSFPKPVRRDL